MIDEQASLYEELNADRQDYLAALAAQRAALEQARESASNTSGSGSTSDQPTTDYSGYTPPVNASAAQVAVSARCP